MNPLLVKVPGKLLLAGEYAILEPGTLALGLAVNRYLEVEIKPAENYLIESESAGSWEFSPESLWSQDVPAALGFAVSALRWGWRWLDSRQIALPSFEIRIRSQLELEKIKLGLGSSAAVCVGVIAALLAAAAQDPALPSRRLLFQLALLAHRTLQGSGSGADIAACVYGSVVAYSSPDLQRLPLRADLPQLLAADWPLLGLEKLSWPSDWGNLQFGWTGQSADTAVLIEDYRDWSLKQPDDQAGFLFESHAACLGLREAILSADVRSFSAGLARCRRILQSLGAEWPEPPETPLLAELADCAEALGGAAKFSGAGGGDCGLAWVEPSQVQALHQAWQARGIQPLDLRLDTEGVSCERITA